MLNGVDLAGRRAFTDTVLRDSWEARLSAEVEASAAVDGAVRAAPRTMGLGGTRVARSFRLPPGPGGLDPVTAVLAALGGCVAAEAAVALTAADRSPDRLSVTAHCDTEGGVGWELCVEGEVSAKEAVLAATEAAARSCVHHTLAEPAAVTVAVPSGGLRTVSEPGVAAAGPSPARTVTAEWETGTLVHVRGDGVAGDGWALDRPKQLFGSDRAPGPVEHLLAALAAEALQHLPGGGSVFASGRVDLRGSLTGRGAPVGVRDVLAQYLPGHADTPGPADALARWCAHGPVLRLLRDARPVEAALRLDGDPVDLPDLT